MIRLSGFSNGSSGRCRKLASCRRRGDVDTTRVHKPGANAKLRHSRPENQNHEHSHRNPPSVTVPAGSSTTFTALFAPTLPQGGSLTWSVSPANGGTITNAGVYLAPATAGNCLVIATWTPSNAAAGIRITGFQGGPSSPWKSC